MGGLLSKILYCEQSLPSINFIDIFNYLDMGVCGG